MNHLANSLTIKPKMRMLFILCGASGLRIGEALGIRIEKILEGGTRIIINEKAWRGEIHDFLKTENGDREIDLPENVAKLLVEFIGDRKSGLLFRSRNGKQLWQFNILRPLLRKAASTSPGTMGFAVSVTRSSKTIPTVQREFFTSGSVGVARACPDITTKLKTMWRSARMWRIV